MKDEQRLFWVWGIVFLWTITPLAQAQKNLQKNKVIDTILERTNKHQIGTYQFPKIDTGYLKLNMAFDKFEAINPQVLARLRSQKIFAIDLVYSQFPKNKSFENLNYNRLKNLQKYLPKKIQSKDIAWRYFGQNDCETYQEAYRLFHGLVVYFYPLKDTINVPPPVTKNPEIVIDSTEIKKKMEIGRIKSSITTLPPLSPKTIDYTQRHTFYQIVQEKYLPDDSTVFKTFARNTWDSMLVVIDWTGSMYHHGAQLLVWMEMFHKQKDRLRNFLFFNDGDGKRLGEKIIGQTGGLHYTSAQNLDEVIATMHKAEKHGTGDDTPENDMEAVIKGIKLFPDSKDIILIADATSPVRDYILLKHLIKMKRPVHIILCGKPILPDYILMAYYTNGSLHTIKEDITNIRTRLIRGEEVEIDNTLIKIKRKRFQFKRKKKKRKRRRKRKVKSEK